MTKNEQKLIMVIVSFSQTKKNQFKQTKNCQFQDLFFQFFDCFLTLFHNSKTTQSNRN